MRGGLVARGGIARPAARWAANGLLVLLSITLFFAGIEVFLRVIDRRNQPMISANRFAGIPKGIVDLADLSSAPRIGAENLNRAVAPGPANVEFNVAESGQKMPRVVPRCGSPQRHQPWADRDGGRPRRPFAVR
jgi:hypothetical protein